MRKFIFLSLFFLTLSILQTQAQKKTLYTGKWTKKSYAISGTWKIISEGGKKYVVLSSDFKTKYAPDLKIFFSKRTFKELRGSNAASKAIFVTNVKKVKGYQKFKIPSNIKVSDYKTIVFHCKAYSKLWAASTLKKP